MRPSHSRRALRRMGTRGSRPRPSTPLLLTRRNTLLPVVGNVGQYPVLIRDESLLGTGARPPEDTKRRAHRHRPTRASTQLPPRR